MKDIDKKIKEQYAKSLNLKKLSVGNDKISYEKGRELQKQQKEEWNKLLFLKNLRKEMMGK